MSRILAVNAGSSSLKFQLFSMPEEDVLAKGLVDRIGSKGSSFILDTIDEEYLYSEEIKDHEEAVKIFLDKLTKVGIIESLNEIEAVGHRVVHGGEYFSDSVPITEEVLNTIELVSELAPLHNPPNIVGIRAFKEILPNVPMVAVFDTAFHQTMPEKSFLYSLPYEYYEKYGVRKYGFHGTSHKYVSEKASEVLEIPLKRLRLITCHLGNGASITAVENGKSIDTSMGFTPLAGVTMGTRSGDLDPAIIPYLMEKTGHNAAELIDIMNKKSGLLAISGISNDLRDIEAEADTNERAKLALDIFAARIHQYIGSYAAKMGGVDAIIFTAGVGENSETIRERILTGLEFMGVYWDHKLNKSNDGEGFINYPHSPVKVMVIPTNEEVMIARDALKYFDTIKV